MTSATEAWRSCHQLLSGFPVIVDTTVAWGEMDAFAHVNNIVYFRYFESARMAYFDRIGYSQTMQATGYGPILAETRCRFRTPLDYPDFVSVGAHVAKVDTDRFLMKYAVASASAQRIAADGDGMIVSYDYKAAKKIPLPPDIVEAIRTLEG